MRQLAIITAAISLTISTVGPVSAGLILRNDGDYPALQKPETSWVDLKDRATCAVDASAPKKKILALVVGVDRVVHPVSNVVSVFGGVPNDLQAVTTLLRRAYSEETLTVHTTGPTTVGALRDIMLGALREERCPDLVFFHFSGAASKDGDSSPDFARSGFKSGYCSYYLMVGESASPSAATPRQQTELCDVALRNAATAFRNRGAHFVAAIDTNYAELADFGRTERGRTIWKRDIAAGLGRVAKPVEAMLHSGAASFAAFYGASAMQLGMEGPVTAPGMTGKYGNLTAPFVQALGANFSATPRDIVDVFGLKAEAANASLLAEASAPDQSVFFPWRDAAAPRSIYEIDDYLSIAGLEVREGQAVAPNEKAMIAATIKFPHRAKIKAALVDNKQTRIAPDGTFNATVQFNRGVNKVRITLITTSDEFIPFTIDVVFREGSKFKPAGKQYALLIANQDYAGNGWADLSTPVGDVAAIGKVLRERYGMITQTQLGGVDTSLVLKNTTRTDVLTLLNRLIDAAGPDDSILVFYAGHGQKDERTKKAYWVPVNAGRDDYYNWISSDDLKAAFEREDARAKHILVVADSCYSGDVFREQTRQVSLSSAVAETERLAYFERLYAKRSRLAISSGASEPVLDGGGQGHSIFARAFIKALDETEAPAFTSADLYANYLVRFVSTGAAQTPTRTPFSLSDSGGDFVFVRRSE